MRPGLLLLLAWSFLLAAGCGGCAAESKLPLEKQVEVILTENCHRCHGRGGSPDADFYVLDRDSLLARAVEPGSPDRSLLYMTVTSGNMPLDQPPLSPRDQEIIKQWIAAGAPDFNDPPAPSASITPRQIVELVQADLQQLSETDRPFTRYFSIAHLSNAGMSDDRLETHRTALSKLVNSLSWQPQIVPPRAIDPSRTLFRIDLRNYRWNAGIWETIVAAYPYGVLYETPAEKFCTTATGSALPLVRGDWFVFAASRPPLYHDVLQLPTTDLELEKTLQVNVSENIRTRAVARGGVHESQTVGYNRLLERHESPLTRGAYWKTYDFANSDDLRNLMKHPLGPQGHADNAFEHDGGEILFNLPNGLQAYLIVDARGNRVDATILGAREDRRGRADVNGVSCMACHAKGIVQAEDAVLQQVEARLSSFSSSEVDLIRALYVPPKKFAELQQKDALRFADAVIQTGARFAHTDPIATLAHHFEDDLTLKLAAAEAGVTPDEFHAGVEKSPVLSDELRLAEKVARTIPRELFLKMFGTIVRELGSGTPFVQQSKEK